VTGTWGITSQSRNHVGNPPLLRHHTGARYPAHRKSLTADNFDVSGIISKGKRSHSVEHARNVPLCLDVLTCSSFTLFEPFYSEGISIVRVRTLYHQNTWPCGHYISACSLLPCLYSVLQIAILQLCGETARTCCPPHCLRTNEDGGSSLLVIVIKKVICVVHMFSVSAHTLFLEFRYRAWDVNLKEASMEN
jgi:hypothetical protein